MTCNQEAAAARRRIRGRSETKASRSAATAAGGSTQRHTAGVVVVSRSSLLSAAGRPPATTTTLLLAAAHIFQPLSVHRSSSRRSARAGSSSLNCSSSGGGICRPARCAAASSSCCLLVPCRRVHEVQQVVVAPVPSFADVEVVEAGHDPGQLVRPAAPLRPVELVHGHRVRLYAVLAVEERVDVVRRPARRGRGGWGSLRGGGLAPTQGRAADPRHHPPRTRLGPGRRPC